MWPSRRGSWREGWGPWRGHVQLQARTPSSFNPDWRSGDKGIKWSGQMCTISADFCNPQAPVCMSVTLLSLSSTICPVAHCTTEEILKIWRVVQFQNNCSNLKKRKRKKVFHMWGIYVICFLLFVLYFQMKYDFLIPNLTPTGTKCNPSEPSNLGHLAAFF